ncbi:MAG: hypothetical protein WCT32_05670 [Patescibacteria group bacterium]|jgi:hypothetical protein
MNLINRVAADASAAETGTAGLKLNLTGSSTTLDELVVQIAGWIGVIAGVLAFFYLVYSGILYLTAGGNAEQTKKAQQGIINAVIGIIIIILAYTIVSAVSKGFGSATEGGALKDL